MLPQEIIGRKRDKNELSTKEIRDFIAGIKSGEIADSQVAALTMAIYLNGLNNRETTDLTLAMRDSGNVLSWKGLDKPIVDKHSSGGVGDKASLMVAPILAACDVYVPMISGRGLGHTGGTVDKLEAIPNYDTQPANDVFRRTVKDVGCAIIGQTGELAPADKKIYAIRDVCATVESIPLITASILSKKLAAGLQYLVMDLKCGNGAFMQNYENAQRLAQSIVKVADEAGTKTRAVLTDMNQVLGTTVGNALEVREAVEYLKNTNVNPRLDIVTKTLCAELLSQCGRCLNQEEGLSLVEKVLSSGQAAEKFAQMVAAFGGPTDFIEHYNKYLPQALHQKAVYASKAGYVYGMNTRSVGLSIIKLKGGRSYPNEKLDLTTGFTNFVQIGDKIDEKTPLAIVYYQNEDQYEAVKKDLSEAIIIKDIPPAVQNPILDII